MSEELRDQLKQASANLQNINATLTTVSKLIEAGKVSVADATEGVEEPAMITLNGEIVGAVLRPVTATLNRRKEQMLSIKEQILTALESEASGEGGDAPVETSEPVETAVQSEQPEKK